MAWETTLEVKLYAWRNYTLDKNRARYNNTSFGNYREGSEFYTRDLCYAVLEKRWA